MAFRHSFPLAYKSPWTKYNEVTEQEKQANTDRNRSASFAHVAFGGIWSSIIII